MIADTQTAFTAWLYEHNLVGLTVGFVAAVTAGVLYRLAHRYGTVRRMRVILVLTGLLTVAGAAGFFLMADDTFLSAACGVVGVSSLLMSAGMLLRRKSV